MKFAYDVPGYVAGHRFTQDRRYYDADNDRFLDLAGYKNYVEKTAGTAAFSNHGTYSREGLLLDRSNQWWFDNPIPWEGTMLVVAKAHIPTASQNVWTWKAGDITSAPTSNGLLGFQTSIASALTMASITPNAGVIGATAVSKTQDAIVMLAVAYDQETRKGYHTSDGVTVTESAAAAGTTNGVALAWGGNGNVGLTGTVGARKVALGDNDGDGTTTANATDYVYVFEQHFWKGNVLRNNLADFKAFRDSVATYYGIS